MRLAHDQREIDRRGVVTVIQQAFGDVHGADVALGLEFRRRGDELVHASLAVGHGQKMLDLRQQIVGIKHGVFGHAFQTVRPVSADVAIHADQHAHAAEKASHPADRLGTIVIEVISLAVFDHDRARADMAPSFSHTAIGPAPGPPPP